MLKLMTIYLINLQDKKKMKDKIFNIIVAFFVVAAAAFLIIMTCTNVVQVQPVELNESVDSVAILTSEKDSFLARISILENYIKNRESELNLRLEKQRKYYEDKINRIRSLPADSSLIIFTDYTSRRIRHDLQSSN